MSDRSLGSHAIHRLAGFAQTAETWGRRSSTDSCRTSLQSHTALRDQHSHRNSRPECESLKSTTTRLGTHLFRWSETGPKSPACTLRRGPHDAEHPMYFEPTHPG